MGAESRFTPDEKAEIVLATIEGRRQMADICREHQVTTTTVYRWKEQFIEAGKAGLKGNGPRQVANQQEKETQDLRELVGELALANFAMKRGRTLSTRNKGGRGRGG